MKNQILRKAGICCLSASLLVSVGILKPITAKAQDTAVTADIYPVPQVADYTSSEGMQLQDSINIVLHGKQVEAMEPKLKEMLTKNGIHYETSDALRNDMSNVVISSDKAHCDVCGSVSGDSLKHQEGYVLVSNNDTNPKGNITIVGADSDGAYYGMMTLGQMISQKVDNKIAELKIEDYPEIIMRGYIEGFYGAPWTHQERMSLMSDTAKYKMNTYIYAPKDDPYHRTEWKALYPEDKAQEIAELAQAGHDNNFNFCWTIHPGATLKFNETDYQAVITKYEQLYSLGVRQFGMLFDDTDDYYGGQKQADFINRIDTEFVKAKGDVKPMIVISARYNSSWGPSPAYSIKPYMATLHSDIQIMWTGAATMSNVSKEVFDWPRVNTGIDRDVAVWWNYPVNDYCDNRILMAPLHNLNPDLDNVTGFFSNPMQQADASKVALYSIADYSWNTNVFNYKKSWERAIEELVPEQSTAFKNFAEDTSYLKDDGGTSGPFVYNESWNSTELIKALEADMKNGSSIKNSSTALLQKFQTIISDAENLTKMKNKNLLEETVSFIGAYGALGEAGSHAMKALQAAENGQLMLWLNEYNAAKAELDRMETFKFITLEGNVEVHNTVAVGTQYLQPSVMAALNGSSKIISGIILPEGEIAVYDSKGDVSAEVINEDGHQKVKNATTSLGKDDTLTFALPKATSVSTITMRANTFTNIKMQSSLNGITWTDLNTTINDGVMVVTEKTPMTFVRICNTSDASIDLTVNEIDFASALVEQPKPTIKTNAGTYQTNDIKFAIDGKMDTRYWNDKAVAAGHYVQLDLGKEMSLYDVTGYFGDKDFIDKGRLEISLDGSTWTSIGDITYTLEGDKKVSRLNADGKKARHLRYYVTQNQNSWLQIFEIEINKYTKGDGKVNVVESNMDGKPEALADGDLTSAFTPSVVHNGDYVSYQLTRETNFAELKILQGANTICNADVSVKNVDGTWQSIGKLDKQLSSFAMNKTITDVKLTFDESQPLPSIFEIMTSNDTINTVELSDAITAADKLLSNAALYTTAYVNQLKAVCDEAKAMLGSSSATQGDIDTMCAKLRALVANPVLREDTTLMKGILANAISKAEAAVKSEAFDTLAPAVKTLINRYLVEANSVYENADATNADVMNAWINLVEIMHYLDFIADKTELNALISECELIVTDDYTIGVEEFKAALASAKAVSADDNALQARIDAAYGRLFAAKEGLGKEEVNKAILKMFIDQANRAKANAEKYKDDANWSAMIEALNEAEAVFTNAKATQSEVNGAMMKLSFAYENIRLLPNEQMLAELNKFIETAKGINKTLYSAKNYAKIQEVLVEAEEMYNGKDFTETQFHAMLDKINDAYKLIDEGKLETPRNPIEPVNPNSPSATPDGVNTGDTTNVAGFMIIAGFAGLMAMIVRRRYTKGIKN